MPFHVSRKGVQEGSRSGSLDSGQEHPEIPEKDKDMFLDYGSDKRFVVKGTSMQILTLIQMILSLNLDTYLKWEQLARVAPCRALWT